jgi:para-aminobenzoate synthetase / 4-amino-4-deoxychorismate lyase
LGAAAALTAPAGDAVVPVFACFTRARLGGAVQAADAALLVAADAHPVALIGRWAGSQALVASEPLCLGSEDADPFALVERVPHVADAAPEAVGGGWFGFLGYDLGHALHGIAPTPRRLPRASLAYYDHLLRLDAGGQWWFEALWTPRRAPALRRRREELAQRLAAPCGRRPVTLGTLRPVAAGWRGHRAAIEACRQRIAAGEIFQANLSIQLETEWSGDPAQLFTQLAAALVPDYGAFVAGPWGALASASPELFLRREARVVRTAPIKGTMARAGETAEDELRRHALAASSKDRAENVMIVDLMRSDLGRVCEFGSVQVEALAEPRPGPGVWHLVSEVSGALRADVRDGDLLRATFPPGSVTGAPKRQTLRVIGDLEPASRGAYTGAAGYVSPCAGLELNVAIRTFELHAERARLAVGGGITWSSDPDAEIAECVAKAAPLAAAAGGRVDLLGRDRDRSAPPRHAPSGAELRPDAARGVFETVRIAAGKPCHLAQHLRRLATSARALYGVRLPADLELRAHVAAARVRGPGRLRISFVPGAPVRIEAAPHIASRQLVQLTPWMVPGGLGPHKWLDRRLLAELDGRGAGTPLIVDGDGSVLEVAWGNVWVMRKGRLVTPPCDGRLLAGVTRERLLAQRGVSGAERVEAPFTLAALRDAEQIFVSSALRGLVPARLG